jgi:predicted nucleotidyltransferase
MSDAASTVKVTQMKGSEIVPMGLKVPVGKSLRSAIQKIVRELDPQKIVLFGSYAYGQPNPHSDVDLLVIMESDQPHKERSWAVSRLLLPRPFPVDILVKTPEEIKEALETDDFFLKEILTRGVVLYERNK